MRHKRRKGQHQRRIATAIVRQPFETRRTCRDRLEPHANEARKVDLHRAQVMLYGQITLDSIRRLQSVITVNRTVKAMLRGKDDYGAQKEAG